MKESEKPNPLGTDLGEIKLAASDACGSCWLSNGTIELHVTFKGRTVTVSAYPPGGEMDCLPVVEECLGLVTWGLKS